MSDQSGSEERRKPYTVAFRVDEDERESLEAVCQPGESPGQMARRLALAHAGSELRLKPRKRHHKPRPGDKELSWMRGQLGKIGENVNRLGRLASSNLHIDPVELAVLRKAVEDIRDVIRAAFKDA